MAEQVLKNVKLFMDGYNLSGDMNSCTITRSVDLVDNTVMGSSTRTRTPGLQDYEVSVGGFWNSSNFPSTMGGGKVDPVIWNKIGSSNDCLSVLPDGTAVGAMAIFSKAYESEYSPGGTIGGMIGFDFTAHGNSLPVKGKVLYSGWLSSNSTATSPKVNIGKVGAANSSGRKFEAAVHVLKSSASGAVSATLVITRGTSTQLNGNKSTMYSFALSTDVVGTAIYGSTHEHGTSGTFTYKLQLLRAAGSSQNRIKALVVIGHENQLTT